MVDTFRTADGGKTLDFYCYGYVGDDWYETGISAEGVALELKRNPDVELIRVFINSLGGSAFDGTAIRSLLMRHPARVEVTIDGVAASAASVIALAGDVRRISDAGLFMIHQAWMGTRGDVREHERSLALLTQMNDSMAAAYAKASGMPVEQMAQWMDAETWFKASDALAAGFVTEVIEGSAEPPAAARVAATAADITRLGYRHAPAELSRFFDFGAAGAPALRPAAGPMPPPDPQLRLPQTDPSPRGAGPTPIPDGEEEDMSDKTNTTTDITAALGVDSIASASARLALVAQLEEKTGKKGAEALASAFAAIDTMTRVGGLAAKAAELTGKDGDEAVAVLTAWKASAAQVPELQTRAALVDELVTAAGKTGDDADREAVDEAVKALDGIEDAQMAQLRTDNADKLHPAAAQSLDGLLANTPKEQRMTVARAFVAALPTVPGRQPKAAPASPDASVTGAPTWNGKTYAELKGGEKADLKRKDPDLFKAMQASAAS